MAILALHSSLLVRNKPASQCTARCEFHKIEWHIAKGIMSHHHARHFQPETPSPLTKISHTFWT